MKKMVTVVMVVAFALSAGAAFAKDKCTVDSVDGDTVTMTCKGTKMKAGDKVTVKAKKKKAIEGC